MSELSELYQEVILDHNRKPRNFRKMEDATHAVEGFNPLCGDHITVYVRTDGERIDDISFEGAGCAISKASASMMTANLKGKSAAEAEEAFQRVHEMLTSNEGPADEDALGSLVVLAGVREFPTRVKCATLSWHAMRSALRGEGATVSTE
jgi:nitrogen fixation protein NifU and related proteins